jgi:hypothetical protein
MQKKVVVDSSYKKLEKSAPAHAKKKWKNYLLKLVLQIIEISIKLVLIKRFIKIWHHKSLDEVAIEEREEI